jgi:hypothetical protein
MSAAVILGILTGLGFGIAGGLGVALAAQFNAYRDLRKQISERGAR